MALLRDVMMSTTDDIATAALGALHARKRRVEADLRKLADTPIVRVTPPEVAEWDQSIADNTKRAEDCEAAAAVIEGEIAAAEAEHPSWGARLFGFMPRYSLARAARATFLDTTGKRLADRHQNAKAYRGAVKLFERKRASIIADQKAAEDEARAKMVQSMERYLRTLTDGIEMIRAEPLTAVEARVNLSAAVERWREREEAARVAFEPP